MRTGRKKRRHRSPDGSRLEEVSLDGMGIGEVSRDEAEYDFAILFRPSKEEEVPDAPCDIPVTVGSRLYFKQNPQRAKDHIIQKLKESGLDVKRLRAIDGKQTLVKVKAPQHVLELGAEQMKMKKRRRVDMTWTTFTTDTSPIFSDYDEATGIKFIDSERQTIVHHLITSDHGAGINDASSYSYIVEQMFPLHKEDLSLLRHNWVTFWRPKLPFSRGNSIRSTTSSNGANSRVLRCTKGIIAQPIDEVAQYFGEKIAFYFAWLEMYTRWLVVPSIAGCVLFAIQIYDKSLDQPLAPYYATFMALWASTFLIAWRRHANVLAYRWGVLGFEEEETTRPDFRGDPAISTATLKRYPIWKRWVKYVFTWCAISISIGGIVSVMYFAFREKDYLEQKSINEKKAQMSTDLPNLSMETLSKWIELADWDFFFYLFITPVLYGIFIPVIDQLYTRVARRLNHWENHKTDSSFQTHLILKVFSFRFVHVFASLYYYAFASDSNLLKVAIQLAAFMIAGQAWNNFMETGLPFIKRRISAWSHRRQTNQQIQRSSVFKNPTAPKQLPSGRESRSVLRRGRNTYTSDENRRINGRIQEQCMRLEQATAIAWEESRLAKYDTFEDYTEMLIQFGYVSFFSIAFPLAPLLALLNNLFELRSDAFKLCSTKQRPLARKASGIGIWFSVLQLMSVMAVITNCIHIAFTTTQIESQVKKYFGIHLSPADKVWVVFLAEHLILAAKMWIAFVIPTMPYAVKKKLRVENEHAKAETAKSMAQSLARNRHNTDCGDAA